MMKSAALCLALSLPSLALSAESALPQKSIVNLSLFDPLSTNGASASETSTHLCIGLIQCSSRDLHGLGLSSLINTIEGEGRGAEIAALANRNAGSFHGFQFATYNSAGGGLGGFQMGFFNRVGKPITVGPWAVSFGLINVSEQERTIPIGILNFVKGGRFDLEVSNSASGYNRVSLVMGSDYFFTLWDIDSAGVNPGKTKDYHRHKIAVRSLGFGLAVPVMDKIGLRYDYMHYAPTYFRRDALISRRLLLEVQANDHLRFQAGGDWSQYRYDWTHTDQNKFSFVAGAGWNLLGFWK